MTEQDLEQIRAVINAELAPMRAQLAQLQELQADATDLKADVSSLKTDISSLKADVSGLKAEIGAWPDLNFLQAAAQQQMSEAKQAREFRRHVEIKLDEIYGSMATSSEISKLREEVAESTERERALDLRVATIENRLGIKNPLSTE